MLFVYALYLVGKFKAHELRLKSKGDLVKDLEGLKEELSKVFNRSSYLAALAVDLYLQ